MKLHLLLKVRDLHRRFPALAYALLCDLRVEQLHQAWLLSVDVQEERSVCGDCLKQASETCSWWPSVKNLFEPWCNPRRFSGGGAMLALALLSVNKNNER